MVGVIILQKSILQPTGTDGKEWKLKTGLRMGSLKTASSGVKKTMLVLTFSHSTRIGQKRTVLVIHNHLQMFIWLPHARGEWCTPQVQQYLVCTESDMVWHRPNLGTQIWQQKSVGGKKRYAGKQAGEKKESRGWSQPATLTQSRGGIPGWTHTEVREDELPCEIHVFIVVCKVSGLASTLRHHQ